MAKDATRHSGNQGTDKAGGTLEVRKYHTTGLPNCDTWRNDFSRAVYSLFNWKKVDVVLKDYMTGKTIVDMQNLEFPESYSQNACDIIATKYFVKQVRDDDGKVVFEGETSMRDIVHRMVSFWVLSMADLGLIGSNDGQVIYDELAYMMLDQRWAPNSPQFFNTGLFHSYGITGSGNGHFYYDIPSGEVRQSADSYSRTQGSACFILGVEDSLLGDKSLTDSITTETLLFKYGSGVGSNWSKIRAKGEYLSGGGKSSGLLSFLKVSDRNAGAIKSGGTTRRAAKMNMLNLDHPEIMDYINWKSREEEKIVALGKMGYDTGFDGEAYDTVSGQNANNSVRIPDNFMHKLKVQDAVWQLKGRVTDDVNADVRVDEIWDAIAKAAHRCGDPGVQYDDIINAWHTCPAGEDGTLGADYNRINGSNPCSEYMFLDDTACNLASINVLKFYDEATGNFDVEGYCHAIQLIQMVLEATIHWGQFPTADIARKSHKFRTTGIGLTNLGTLMMYMGLPYDSDRARTLAAALCSIMTGQSYYTSAQMAEKVGAFECYELNAAHMKRVIRNHARAAAVSADDFEDMPYRPVQIDHNVLRTIGMESLSDCLMKAWAAAIAHGEERGYRNAQVSVLAPTGTIAFAMDCDSTSSEPFFTHIAFKKLVGGGSMIVANGAIRNGLHKLGYTEKQADEIVEYIMRTDDAGNLVDGKIEGAPYISSRPEHIRVFDTANRCGTGERFLSPESHVKMLAALTPHVTGAISKTVNLPRQANTEYIKDIYQLSWELGVKAVALYRDGSKESQPLNIDNNALHGRVKPYGIRDARIHEALFADSRTRVYVITSFYGAEDGEQLQGKLAEIFVVAGKQGSLTKGLLETMGIGISKSLQYGMPAEEIAKMYAGHVYEPAGMILGHPFVKNVTSISDLVSQIIAREAEGYDLASLPAPTPAYKNGGKRVKPTGIRAARVHEAKIDTSDVFVVASFYNDSDAATHGFDTSGKHLAEIFAFCDEQGTTVKGMLGSLAASISISLQSGVPAENIAKINRRQSYEPSGLVSGHPYIGAVSSVSDLISKVIDISYGNYDNCQIKPAGMATKAKAADIANYSDADMLYGETCSSCGSDKMVQSGVCKVCVNCGTTTGCS